MPQLGPAQRRERATWLRDAADAPSHRTILLPFVVTTFFRSDTGR
ncbi:hypothetical protein [Nonomuraea sp. JJY05]